MHNNKHTVKIQRKCDPAVLEQWKTCVESANGISEKRNSANNVYITINAALIAVISFSFDYKSILLSVIGISICILWMCSLNNYRLLNKVKYDIITEMEKKLPCAPFSDEWNNLLKEKQYVGLTRIERFLPIVFIIVYSIAILFPTIKGLLLFICPCLKGA